MAQRSIVLALILACSLAQAQTASPPSDKPPAEIDVDAMARSKDVGAQPAPTETPAPAAADAPAAVAPTVPPAAAPAPGNTTSASQDAVALTPPPMEADQKRLAAGCQARTTTLLDAAQRGDFAAATHDFDAKMRTGLPPEKFREIWGQLAQFGSLNARGESHVVAAQGYLLVDVPLIFEKANLFAQVTCGSDGRIAGFYVKPLPKPAS